MKKILVIAGVVITAIVLAWVFSRYVIPIVSVLDKYQKIKVGATRQEIEGFLTPNGGISNQFPQRVDYLFDGTLVHVRVDFVLNKQITKEERLKLVGQKEYWQIFEGAPDDKVKGVSLPFIAPFDID